MFTLKLTQIGNSVGMGQMNATWRWISKPALVMLHDESLAEHGGAEGVLDEGSLDSALARSLNIVARSDATEPPEDDAFAAQAPGTESVLPDRCAFL